MITRRGMTVALFIAATATLSGCSIGYVPPGDAASAPAASPTPTPTPSAPPSAAAPSASGDDPAADLRAEYEAAANRISCPGGTLVVSEAAAVVSVAEDCDSIRIAASGTVVLAAGVGTLTVEGAANRVQVVSAEAIDVAGSGNDVRWQTGEPRVSDTGAGNTMRPTTEG
ncbi:DUF3060 domain-containing protein [Microbacterium sp. NPDC089189]|uniref:DUF3060 domain-containing protein n=1 Tax=Microbacterium sp. NPDC089189 TaxID=3154972 RepID=UPI00343C8292